MKYFTLFLIVALIGKIAAAPPRNPFSPKYSYRVDREQPQQLEVVTDESSEDGQSDEADVEDEEPQQDEDSDEVDEDSPPKFNKLFPTPSGSQGRPGGPSNLAFETMMKEIDENGWKRPKENPTRGRTILRRFRDDDEDSDEDEDEEDDLDDDAESPDFDLMFPNPEGKPSGPTNLPVSSQLDDLTSNSIEGLSVDSGPVEVARSFPYDGSSGRSQEGPVYATSNVRYIPRNRYVSSQEVSPVAVSYVQGPYYYGGNRRVMSVPMSHYREMQMRRPSYSYPQKQMSYYRPMQQMSYRPYEQMYQMPSKQMSMSYRPRQPVGQMYVDGYGKQQYYVPSPVRRTQVPMSYMRQPIRPRQPMQQYYVVPTRNVMRNRRNGRYWNNRY